MKRVAVILAALALAGCAAPAHEPSAWKTYKDPATGVVIRCYVPNGLESNATTLGCYRIEESEIPLLFP